MNTETLTVHPEGDDFEIIVEHDQTGSAYGTTLSKSAYEQLRLHFVSDLLLNEDMILKEADYRQVEGAEPHSWAGGARWAKRKLLGQ